MITYVRIFNLQFGVIINYWDYDANTQTSNHNPNIYSNPAGNQYEKEMRRNLSLNTCQGCHAGETKTLFTHVAPISYGVSAEYWTSPPDKQFRHVDARFYNNPGETTIAAQTTQNYAVPTGKRHCVKVSAFLTGRNYSGISGTYDDDETNTSKDFYPDNDAQMRGLFFVNDPSNRDDHIEPHMRFGYNDLEMRKVKLCNIAKMSCEMREGDGGSVIIRGLVSVLFNPSPKGSH